MNGDSILAREVAGNIERLEDAQPLKGCAFAEVVRDSTIRSLRIGEYACKGVYQTRLLLWAVLAVLLLKPENVTIWDLLKWIAMQIAG